MKKTLVLSIAVLVFVSSFVSAELVRGIDIDFVAIGNAGNVADAQVMNDGTSGYGAVDYNYQIGKYEITNSQWNSFISAAGAPVGSPSNAYDESAYWTGTNEPVNNVSWYEAAQFCNYLTSGDKSQGAYQFDNDDFTGIDRLSAVSTYGIAYVIPTEDEWHKTAYYTGSGYSTYATGLDTIPSPVGWNYTGGTVWDVGTGTEEQNGTFDIMGNLQEFTETYIGSNPSIRGGSVNGGLNDIQSSYRNYVPPFGESGILGFRVASVPEPMTLALLALGGVLIRKRK